jgi:hypothetical protein
MVFAGEISRRGRSGGGYPIPKNQFNVNICLYNDAMIANRCGVYIGMALICTGIMPDLWVWRL